MLSILLFIVSCLNPRRVVLLRPFRSIIKKIKSKLKKINKTIKIKQTNFFKLISIFSVFLKKKWQIKIFTEPKEFN